MIKTVSLSTAQALKEAGFRQDTGFHWYGGGQYRTELCYGMLKIGGVAMEILDEGMFNYAAPTTDDLIEELPGILLMDNTEYGGEIKSNVSVLVIGKPNDIFNVQYRPNRKKFESESLPEALAQMWLHLKKESLL